MTTMKNRVIKYKKEIERLKDQLQQKENIIKEVREYIEKHKETRKHYEPYGTPMGNPNYITTHIFGYYELLEILDKEGNG